MADAIPDQRRHLFLADEQQREIIAGCHHEDAAEDAHDDSDDQSVFHTGFDPIQLSGPQILSAVGGHGQTQGLHGLVQKRVYFTGGIDGCYDIRPQGVDRTLQDDGSDGCHGKLQPHGNAQGK